MLQSRAVMSAASTTVILGGHAPVVGIVSRGPLTPPHAAVCTRLGRGGGLDSLLPPGVGEPLSPLRRLHRTRRGDRPPPVGFGHRQSGAGEASVIVWQEEDHHIVCLSTFFACLLPVYFFLLAACAYV